LRVGIGIRLRGNRGEFYASNQTPGATLVFQRASGEVAFSQTAAESFQEKFVLTPGKPTGNSCFTISGTNIVSYLGKIIFGDMSTKHNQGR
jgi:hypothetical protein